MKIEPVLKLKEIAEFIHATFKGEPEHIISGINEIHKVETGDITFVDHPKYYEKALNSKATTIIINKELPAPAGKALIYSDDPFRDYVKLVKRFRPLDLSPKMISDTAEIGKGTIIQPNVYIGNHVKIGFIGNEEEYRRSDIHAHIDQPTHMTVDIPIMRVIEQRIHMRYP